MKNSNILCAILCGLLSVLLISCNKVASTTDDTANSATELPKNVKILSDQIWNSNFVYMDSVSKTVTFSKNMASGQNIQTGDILVSSAGDGFLRKVKTVTAGTNTIQVQTEPAYITEVVKEGTIKFDQALTTQRIKSVQMHYDGIKLITSNNKSSTGFPLEINTVLYDADGNNTTTGDQIRLTGTYDCDWKITGQIDITLLSGLQEVKFGFESNQNFDLKMVAGLQYNFEKSYKLATVYFTPITVWVPLTVPFPVVFTPQLDIMVGMSGFANASLTSQFGQSMTFNAGVHWLKARGWSPYQTFTKSMTFQPPTLNVNAGAQIYIKPEMSLSLYSVAGPFVNAKFYGRLDADILQSPWWKLFGGVSMGAGAKVNVIDLYQTEYAIDDIIKYENLLAQATMPPVTPATVTTNNISVFTQSTATAGGNITSDGGTAITERGVVYATTQNPTVAGNKVTSGTGSGSFTTGLTGLIPGTTYFVRAYAVNSQGIYYGTQVSFTTSSGNVSTVTDIEGNIYKTVAIGTQVWMSENLRTTKNSDGSAIPNVTANAAWDALSSGAYSWYNNDASTYKAAYGGLYNWFAVQTGKLCPAGWHVPTDTEWTVLFQFIGGETSGGGKLKESSTLHWINPNTGATNLYGYTGLPGGFRNINGSQQLGYYSYTWSSTQESPASTARAILLGYNVIDVQRYSYNKNMGLSVRCVKDN